jgi:hypothetical protein
MARTITFSRAIHDASCFLALYTCDSKVLEFTFVSAGTSRCICRASDPVVSIRVKYLHSRLDAGIQPIVDGSCYRDSSSIVLGRDRSLASTANQDGVTNRYNRPMGDD